MVSPRGVLTINPEATLKWPLTFILLIRNLKKVATRAPANYKLNTLSCSIVEFCNNNLVILK